MFGPFASVEKKMRQNAANWLELAEKIFHYRRDVLAPAELAELQQKREGVRASLRARDDASKLKLAIESLEDVLRRTGGTFYPKSSLVEYVEFFVVAAIVILGIRAFFVQPFKIPTNSMWPSYHGMTGEVFPTVEDEPGVIAQGVRFAAQLASAKRIDAPTDGEVFINISRVKSVSGRKWGILPAQYREYVMAVGRTPLTITVPADFDLNRVFLDAFFDGAENYPNNARGMIGQDVWVRAGKTVKKGERVLAFDILTGDQLFVDRLSYHFVKPRVGQGFVFRTDHLYDLHPEMAGPKEQYYIKRLVGGPGDTLEIKSPVLYRNGEPITGAEAFEKNADQADHFPGYRWAGRMLDGDEVTVPENHYFAMGDNSASSLDSRYWGAIPEADVVGRPLFIYYPFTKRWGPAP